jgi:exosortase E/protease (VPEID-CTERM system)
VSFRWVFLAAAIVAEILLLSAAFHGPMPAASNPWWVELVANLRNFVRVGVAFFGALFILLAPHLKSTVEDARASAADYRSWPLLLVHLVAFAALYFATAATFDHVGGQFSLAAAMLCAGLAVVTVSLWLLALSPLHYWRGVIVRERLSLAIALLAATAAWLGGQAAEAFWKPMAAGTFFLAEPLLRLVYADVTSDSSELVLGTPEFEVNIAPQCSGYEGIGLVIVFLALYLWLFRSRIRFPQALLLFPIGVAAVWLANVVRIAALVAVGTSLSPTLAEGGFHSQAGWLSFVALALGFIAVTHRMRFFSRMGPDSGAGEEINPTAAALLVPFLVLMGSMMITAAFSAGFDRLYPIKVLATAVALLWFRGLYARWDWSWSWLSVAIGAAVFIVWIVLEQMTGGDGTALRAGIAGLGQSEAAGWIGFRIVGSVIVVPLVEEMAFRGYLLRRLAAGDFEAAGAQRFSWVAFLVSSVAFGLLHARWEAGVIAGMAYAFAYYRRGKLGDAVVAHATTNALIALAVLLAGTWSLWS